MIGIMAGSPTVRVGSRAPPRNPFGAVPGCPPSHVNREGVLVAPDGEIVCCVKRVDLYISLQDIGHILIFIAVMYTNAIVESSRAKFDCLLPKLEGDICIKVEVRL